MIQDTYQLNSRRVDTTALRFGAASDTSYEDWHGSVAYNRNRSKASILENQELQEDQEMRELMATWARCEKEVTERFGDRNECSFQMGPEVIVSTAFALSLLTMRIVS